MMYRPSLSLAKMGSGVLSMMVSSRARWRSRSSWRRRLRGDVLAIEGQALARRKGAEPVPSSVWRVVVLDLDRHPLRHGPVIRAPEPGAHSFRVSLPQVQADLVLPLRDLVRGRARS